MNKLICLSIMLLAAGVAGAESVTSPDGRLVVNVDVNADGTPVYSVDYDGRPVVTDSPLGFITDYADFSRGLKIAGSKHGSIDRDYVQDKIKKSHISVKANTMTLSLKGDGDRKFDIEWVVKDNDVAWRYLIPRHGETGSARIMDEATSWAFPEGTQTFLTSQSTPMIGWKRTKPSYEEFYRADAPMDSVSEFGCGFTFPALFHTPEGDWALVSETGVDGYYCASHLSDYKDGKYRIAYPMATENNGNGTPEPSLALPGATPWRTLTVGSSLAPIAETTIPWDLVEPLYTSAPARPGKGTWSWILWQDGSINYDDQKTYIDFAADMGYQNVLIDNWWDTNIGRERIKELVDYAASKGVNVILWYSSSGDWNDIVQGPTGLMDRPIVRKKEMKWLRDIGVRAIKVDFFGGDKQQTIRLYEDILSDAADHGIDVVFHGCTLPRGWERMYPNFVGAEAVLASENLIFEQRHCDIEAFSATLHPFIRNSVALMEFGGSPLNRRFNRTNDGGNIRRTGDAFELATAVLFQNPVQNFALAPNNLTDAPAEAIEFMRNVPTTWDDIRYIDGYPGRYAVIARRSGDTWYIAGINAEKSPRKFTLDLTPFLTTLSSPTLWLDRSTTSLEARPLKPTKQGTVTLTVPTDCGFVIKI